MNYGKYSNPNDVNAILKKHKEVTLKKIENYSLTKRRDEKYGGWEIIDQDGDTHPSTRAILAYYDKKSI